VLLESTEGGRKRKTLVDGGSGAINFRDKEIVFEVVK